MRLEPSARRLPLVLRPVPHPAVLGPVAELRVLQGAEGGVLGRHGEALVRRHVLELRPRVVVLQVPVAHGVEADPAPVPLEGVLVLAVLLLADAPPAGRHVPGAQGRLRVGGAGVADLNVGRWSHQYHVVRGLLHAHCSLRRCLLRGCGSPAGGCSAGGRNPASVASVGSPWRTLDRLRGQHAAAGGFRGLVLRVLGRAHLEVVAHAGAPQLRRGEEDHGEPQCQDDDAAYAGARVGLALARCPAFYPLALAREEGMLEVIRDVRGALRGLGTLIHAGGDAPGQLRVAWRGLAGTMRESSSCRRRQGPRWLG
mmetsp:Transcript_107958/g.337687  ORF Transcript_107958/g.337687 Transcript_107958/m.337687 type:complete len:312 (+) Transcript_107958:1081-2016(+)